MRLLLLPVLYKVQPALKDWMGWRLKWYGASLHEKCDCDDQQDCLVYREDGVSEWDDEDTGERCVYDPREDCECRVRPPHHHWRVGMMINKALWLPKPCRT